MKHRKLPRPPLVRVIKPKGPAPADLKLLWLLQELKRSKTIYEGRKVDVLGKIAREDYDRRDLHAEAKLQQQLKDYNRFLSSLDWYLSGQRPWNKNNFSILSVMSEHHDRQPDSRADDLLDS